MSDEIRVKGLEQLNDFLQQLPANVEKNVLRGALRAGAQVVQAEVKQLVPVSPPNTENARLYGGYEGALRDSVRVGVIARAGRVIASVKAGGKSKNSKADAFYAMWVEFGTAAHNIVAKSKRGLFFAGGFARHVMHPGAKPKPFMRPALQMAAQRAVVAAAEYMKKRLATKHGLDTSGVDVRAE